MSRGGRRHFVVPRGVRFGVQKCQKTRFFLDPLKTLYVPPKNPDNTCVQSAHFLITKGRTSGVSSGADFAVSENAKIDEYPPFFRGFFWPFFGHIGF